MGLFDDSSYSGETVVASLGGCLTLASIQRKPGPLTHFNRIISLILPAYFLLIISRILTTLPDHSLPTMSIEIINPYNGKKIKSYAKISNKQIKKTIDQAYDTQQIWQTSKFKYRSRLLKKAAKILLKNKKQYADMMTTETGKIRKEAIAEVEKCAWVCEYYADNGRRFLQKKSIKTDATKSYVTYQPLGIVLAVMPWNFPFWQVFRFAAPTLMAGNAALLKHASNVPASGLAIQDIFEKAGFPKGLFSTLLISSDQVKSVLKNPKVSAATLTGSGPAGSAVAASAGAQIKKTVLELGGSDAYLILADVDLDQAVEACVTSRLLNTGQSCIGAKRFVVVEAVYDQFLKKFKAKMKATKMGDPKKSKTDIGPMARFDLRDELHKQVKESVKKGAKIVLGGKIPKSRKGAFYPPTILVDVQSGMPAYDDELFGPVASVIRVENEAAAIQVANDSRFGLGAAVFTKNQKRGEIIAAERLAAGACFVNAYVKSDPRLPFGGIKESGYGRELSKEGILAFVNTKTVYIK